MMMHARDESSLKAICQFAKSGCHPMTPARTGHLLGKCVAFVLIANALVLKSGAGQAPGSAALEKASDPAKAPVDRLIPWLLDEDRQLRGVPFNEVIFDTTGKKVIAFNPNDDVDRAMVSAIGQVLDETVKRMNAPIIPFNRFSVSTK